MEPIPVLKERKFGHFSDTFPGGGTEAEKAMKTAAGPLKFYHSLLFDGNFHTWLQISNLLGQDI
jgi:hypothetical protein